MSTYALIKVKSYLDLTKTFSCWWLYSNCQSDYIALSNSVLHLKFCSIRWQYFCSEYKTKMYCWKYIRIVYVTLGLPYVPLFEALFRFFHRKSRFLLEWNTTDLTTFLDISINTATKAGRWVAVSRLDRQGKASDFKIMTKIGVNSKKKRSTSTWLQNFSSFGLEIGSRRGTNRRWPFFFFFGDHLNFFLWFKLSTNNATDKPVTPSHRPAFDKKKTLEGP